MPQFIREENVKRRLDADESSGFAMARFVLRRGDRCWTPDGIKSGPAGRTVPRSESESTTIVFERLAGQLTYRAVIDGNPYGGRKWGAA
jgi:hypothetical protein